MSIATYPSETTIEPDPITGVPLRRLTDHKGHSHHLYFTNNGWYDRGRRLLFGSDRFNRTNLYSVEPATGAISQLTDADMPGPPDETSFIYACLNPVRDEAYFWRGRDLIALDLHRPQERTLYEAPQDFSVTILNCTADGQYICTSLSQKPGDQPARMRMLRGYVGFRETFLARPLSRVIQVPTTGGDVQTLHEERAWIGHVNTSPTQANLLTFCHEGPWHEVEQRIWCLDRATGRVWKVRPQREGEAIGHEYWMADGLHIGYHGRTAAGPVYGAIGHDNSDAVELPFPHDSHHFHSHDLDLIVGDGQAGRFPYILLWQRDGEGFTPPRILCRHRGSAHVQQTHVHPRLSPDGRSIVFTSDDLGYGNVYTVDVPADIGQLPLLSERL